MEDAVLTEEPVRDHVARIEQVEQRISVLQAAERGYWSERSVLANTLAG